MARLSINSRAPDFKLKDLHGKLIRLSDFHGKKNVVLVFNRGFS